MNKNKGKVLRVDQLNDGMYKEVRYYQGGTQEFVKHGRFKEECQLDITEKEIEKMKNTNILQMALQLEDGLVHAGTLDEKMSVLEFIKHYLAE